MLGHVYLNVDSNSYILSLGFVQYCVLALRLTKKVVHGAVYFFVNTVSDSKLPTMVFNCVPAGTARGGMCPARWCHQFVRVLQLCA